MRFSFEKLLSFLRQKRIGIFRRASFVGHCGIKKGCVFSTSGHGRICIGAGVSLEERVLLHSAGEIIVGRGVYINRDVILVALERIEIGDDTRIAERVSIRDHDHKFEQTSRLIKEQGYMIGAIRIGSDCWIGCNSVILKGVAIGNHVVIGAGSVVTRSIPSNVVAAGVPAKIIRSL
jgi:acetyltransferase-like isoleucine patch superfamily enzyme